MATLQSTIKRAMTAAKLSASLGIPLSDAGNVRQAIQAGLPQTSLTIADMAMGARGVQFINGRTGERMAEYVETGRADLPTLIYDTRTGRVTTGTVADLIAKRSDKWGIKK